MLENITRVGNMFSVTGGCVWLKRVPSPGTRPLSYLFPDQNRRVFSSQVTASPAPALTGEHAVFVDGLFLAVSEIGRNPFLFGIHQIPVQG